MRATLLVLCFVTLGACSSPSSRVAQFEFGDAHTLASTGNLRIITERSRAQYDGLTLPVICTEPSPDYAIAFGTAASATAKADITGSGSGEGGFNVATTEAATQLAGRTAGVLALRDGLYAACQSYVNGVIGQDAYALILSQYGNLLVALTSEKPGEGAAFSAKDAAVSALLVSCISEHDPTRRGAPRLNPLLTPRFCGSLLARVGGGGFLSPAKTPGALRKVVERGPVTGVEATTKTTYGAPKQP